MCIDNPRLGFSDIFDTHPPIDARVEALVKFAGGHDPGPLALEPSEQQAQLDDQSDAEGPWGEPQQQGGEPQQQGPWGTGAGPAPSDTPGPWGPRRG